jgi:hypothetical protein
MSLATHVIAKRYGRASTIITSNLPFTQWATTLAGDGTAYRGTTGSAAASRAHIMQISGQSHRPKDRKKARHLKVAASGQAAVLPTPSGSAFAGQRRSAARHEVIAGAGFDA